MTEGRNLGREYVSGGSSVIHVLVADDDESMCETTARLLEAIAPNFQVEGVSSGAAVLDVIDGGDGPIDCIVSDYEMPEMDGLELLEAVRERDEDVPFIIYTGHGNEDVASEAISAGVTDYVRKSVTGGHQILAARIESAVGRRRAEGERDLQALAMETVEEGIAVIDGDGQFVEVNEAYAELYGYDRDELVGMSNRSINPPEENERMELQILPTLAEEGSWRGESVGLRKDGSTFPKAKSLTALDGGGFVCAVRDVTEQKAAEHGLREQNERLREFARLVSHDLRNPLNVAEGYLALVEESADEDQAENLDRIRSAHDRMRRLIDDMLRLSREGRVVDNPEPVSVAEIAEAAALTVGLGDGSYTIDEALPWIQADEERLSALFENLFRNAVEHAGPDPIVRVAPLADDDGVCGFFVEDDGPGIPENRHVKVFESGFTTDPSGTGFGLAIVKRITNAHGWTVSVRDGTEGGARFEFRGVEVVADDEEGSSGGSTETETASDAVTDGGDGDGSDDGSDGDDSDGDSDGDDSDGDDSDGDSDD
ncbi:hybrid sensor histidine kinase/response regulator [Salinigranum sp. GCM10025319]|uniref:ATP-binding response regulator n=1 Tax=Salinigranum sp. GCM10025319 TaxID=3252687 RepID=UPI003610CFDE